jgi:hypothetical protein
MSAILTVAVQVRFSPSIAVREKIEAMYVRPTALASLVRSIPTALPENVAILMMNVPHIAMPIPLKLKV